MDYEVLGKILQEARLNLKITQSEIANKLGVTFQNVSSWERGKSKIDIDTLVRLCNIYNINFVSVLNRVTKNAQTKNNKLEEVADDELSLLTDYRKLNDDGKEAARNAVYGFTMVPNYKKSSESEKMA